MRQFTQRLMMAVVATFMAVGSLWATTIEFGVTYSNDGEYSYVNTSGSSCDVTINGSCTVWTKIGYADYGSSVTAPYTLTIPAGQTGFFWTSGASSGISFTLGGGTSGGQEELEPQEGDDPAHAYVWSTGSNVIREARTRDVWYMISIPAQTEMQIKMQYFSDSMEGYVGSTNAENKTNAVLFIYDSSIYGNTCNYTNSSESAVDFYIRQVKYSYGYTGTAVVSMYEASAGDHAKAIGSLLFDVENNSEISLSTSSVHLTFPSFEGGAKSNYNIAVTYSVYVYNGESIDEVVSGYNEQVANGTANDGVWLGLPTLVNGKKYEVRVTNVNVTDGDLSQDFTENNSVTFTAINIPDGTQYNPYPITSGVAISNINSGYTHFVFTATADGLLACDASGYFYHSSNMSNYYSNSYSGTLSVTAGQTYYIAFYAYSAMASITFTFRAPVQGELLSDPIILQEGDNTFVVVSGSPMWYKLTIPAGKTYTVTTPTSTYAYVKATDAANNTNYIYPDSKYVDGNYVGYFEGDNKTASATDLYLKVNYNGSEMTGKVNFADYVELNFEHVTGNGTSVSPYEVIIDEIYPAGVASSKVFYQYTADEDCWITFDGSNLKGYYYAYASTSLSDITVSYPSYSFEYQNGIALAKDETIYFVIQFNLDNSGKFVVFHAGEVPEGVTPAKAHDLIAGNNNINAKNEWWSMTVPARATMTFEPQAYMGYMAYAGIENANALDNALQLVGGYTASTLTYTNETGADVVVFIKSGYLEGSVNAVVTLTIPEPATINVNLTADGYASFCWDKNWTAPAGVVVYKATAQEGDLILIEEVSGIIPAYKGVILYGAANGGQTITLTESWEIADEISGNILAGTTEAVTNPATISSATVYALHCVDGVTVFDSYTGENIPANKAYIQLGAGAPARLRVAMAGNTTTGIEAAATVNGGVSKRLINGQLFILRDGKMYNVQGVKL